MRTLRRKIIYFGGSKSPGKIYLSPDFFSLPGKVYIKKPTLFGKKLKIHPLFKNEIYFG